MRLNSNEHSTRCLSNILGSLPKETDDTTAGVNFPAATAAPTVATPFQEPPFIILFTTTPPPFKASCSRCNGNPKIQLSGHRFSKANPNPTKLWNSVAMQENSMPGHDEELQTSSVSPARSYGVQNFYQNADPPQPRQKICTSN